MSKVLIIMSAADVWERTDGSAYPTGYWAEEPAAPHEKFVRSGYTVDFASPGGVLQPLDQHSADPEIAGADCARHVEYAEKVLREFGPLLKLDEVDVNDYVAVVLPGGHGPRRPLPGHRPRPSADRRGRVREGDRSRLPQPGRPAQRRGHGGQVAVCRPEDDGLHRRGGTTFWNGRRCSAAARRPTAGEGR
ncbi:hypothetical protein GCM10027162_07860 [Streptomyces incanus]